jgi:ribosomal-protein-alanine N-acetyltransferase
VNRKIRGANPGDLAAIAEIEGQVFSNPWHPDTFKSLLKRDRARLLVAEDDEGDVAGYAVFWWVLDQAELANLAVRRESQHRGIGSALLDESLKAAAAEGVASIFLEVRMSNSAAHRLYESRGFFQISVRKGYYRNPPEDARILVKFLGSDSAEARAAVTSG